MPAPGTGPAEGRPLRLLVTGGAGMVAGWVVRTAPSGVDLHVTEHRTPVPDHVRALAAVHRVDLTGPGAARDLLRELRPDVVVHAAYTQSSRGDIVDASAAVAVGAREIGAELVHLSTDVVFAGDRPPYTEEDPLDPISDYGRWKAEAERTVLQELPDAAITRTSLVVSLDPPDGATAALADALRAGREVTLFHDELRQPVRADDLAAELWALLALSRGERVGVWHLPGPERLSRLELGRRLAVALGLDPAPIRAGSAADHPTPRPRDTTLVATRRRRLGVAVRPVGA